MMASLHLGTVVLLAVSTWGGADMNHGTPMGPCIIRLTVFYRFCRRGQRAQVFSEEVNAKLKLLSAETGR